MAYNKKRLNEAPTGARPHGDNRAGSLVWGRHNPGTMSANEFPYSMGPDSIDMGSPGKAKEPHDLNYNDPANSPCFGDVGSDREECASRASIMESVRLIIETKQQLKGNYE